MICLTSFKKKYIPAAENVNPAGSIDKDLTAKGLPDIEAGIGAINNQPNNR